MGIMAGFRKAQNPYKNRKDEIVHPADKDSGIVLEKTAYM